MEFTMKQIAQLTGRTYQKVSRTAKELELNIIRENDKVAVDISGLIKILRYYEEQDGGEDFVRSEEVVSEESRVEELERQLLDAQETIEYQREDIANLTRANEMLRGIRRD